MAASESFTFMKYFFFVFAFIISFFLINTKTIEIFGLILFFVINFIFCTLMGKDLTDGKISFKDGTEQYVKYGILLVSLVFSFVSSIMMMMTVVTLQDKFSKNHSDIKWSQTDRQNLDNAEILFITVTAFIGVVALYIYNTAEDIRKFTYSIFDNILGSSTASWLRIVFPIVIIGLGSALYGRLEMDPLIVNKTPKEITCNPKTNGQLQDFKDAFIKTYWFLFAFVVIVLIRPFIEANFDILGLTSTGKLAGFTKGDRTYVFGQNPAISLISLLTFGISNLAGINDTLKTGVPNLRGLVFLVILMFVGFCIWIGLIFGFGSMIDVDKTAIYGVIAIALLSLLFVGLTEIKSNESIVKLLLMPMLRWDSLYSILRSGFGLLGLIFASFTIKHFSNIPSDNACLFRDAHIRQLYIAFIVFLIIFYSFNTLSASTITTLITNIMRYLVPPSLLGMSSYLIFTSNNFMQLAPKLIVQ